jgi:hypothetical protein
MGFAIFFLTLLIAGLVIWLLRSGGPGADPNLLMGILLLSFMDVFIFFAARSQRRALARLMEFLDAGSPRFRGGTFTRLRLEGLFHGRAVAFTPVPGDRNRRGYLLARLVCASPLGFTFSRAAQIRLVKPRRMFLTGAAELDREFVFASADSDRVRPWLLNPPVREQVVALLRRLPLDASLELKHGALCWGFREGKDERATAESSPAAAAATPRAGLELAVTPNFQVVPSGPAATREALESLARLAASLETIA